MSLKIPQTVLANMAMATRPAFTYKLDIHLIDDKASVTYYRKILGVFRWKTYRTIHNNLKG